MTPVDTHFYKGSFYDSQQCSTDKYTPQEQMSKKSKIFLIKKNVWKKDTNNLILGLLFLLLGLLIFIFFHCDMPLDSTFSPDIHLSFRNSL